MNRHPPSNYGDAPRLNGGTMRLLPSGDGADDLASSHRAPSPSHYDPDYNHTPYVYPSCL